MNVKKLAAIGFRRGMPNASKCEDKFIDTRTDLVIARMIIRETMKTIQKHKNEIRNLERREKKLKQRGITVIFLSPWIKERKEALEKFNKAFTTMSALTLDMLDSWEQAGATLKDLCNLCNRDYTQVKNEIELVWNAASDKSFSDLMFIFNIDYPSYEKGDTIKYTADAPFTHVAMAYMFDQILHTGTGRRASSEASKTVFPGMWDNAPIQKVDEYGNVYFTDHKGNRIDFEKGR